ncbi:hypothetical protein [Methanobrevibacter sp.]|uniref:hypothetical protein n=1 Tax=Methanobrevibacter sp. TaxID=66852 RepID=UPI0038706871
MNNNRFVIKKDNDDILIHELGRVNKDFILREINSIEEVIEILNEQDKTIQMWTKNNEKTTKLLVENTKPTYKDNVYLDIDTETKSCKYEHTIICSKCDYYSTYFLDCRLMMQDDQYKKALELGLVKE